MNHDGGVPSALFYIDQFVNGEFFSRSEPFTDKDTCIEYLQFLTNSIQQTDDLYYKISVSMDLNDYQHLILRSNKIHIKFLNNETQTETYFETHDKTKIQDSEAQQPIQNECNEETTIKNTIHKIVAVRKKNGYNIKNSKKNRRLLEKYNLKELCKYNEQKNMWKLRDIDIDSIPLHDVLHYLCITPNKHNKKILCEDYDNCEI